MLHVGPLARREDDEGHEGEDAVAGDEPPRDLTAARLAAHVGRGGRDNVDEEEDGDPAEGRVEGHVRSGRDERADEGADEGEDGEHKRMKIPKPRLMVQQLSSLSPMLNSRLECPGCATRAASPPSLYPFVKQLVKRARQTLCASLNPGCQADRDA